MDVPEEYPPLGDGSSIPFTPRNAPMPTVGDMRRVLHKHRHGSTVPKKSHFPRSWSDQDIEDALELTVRTPDRVTRCGDKLQFTREVDGVEVRVMIRTDPPGPRFWSGYPARG
ncbi:EndoU domain-containing protein [Gordonia sihwensis]|uniref:EndoU domain-containing protein n=1 Tax=Gordonia sihwensis TaxID=173559 RepID=UPI003BF906BA